MEYAEGIIKQFEQNLLSVDRLSARETLLEYGKTCNPLKIADNIITPVLESIGKKWENGDVGLSQVYMSGIICEELLDALIPQGNITNEDIPPIAIVTFEDYHVLGKRLVQSVLRADGLPVADYGAGVQADELVKWVREDHIRILLISTLMLPSALHIKGVREKFDMSGMNVKIVVGGAPFRFDETLWKSVGADVMGQNAAEAVRITRKLLEELS